MAGKEKLLYVDRFRNR